MANPRPLASIFAFPVYATREEYERVTGKPCPPWNPEKPPKYWEDPAAKFSSRKLVSYEPCLMLTENGTIAREDETSTSPKVEEIVLTREDAAAVNIPVKTENGRVISTLPVKPEVQVPLKLGVNDRLVVGPFGVTVQDKTGSNPPNAVGGFTEDDRTLLYAIARKVGVQV